MFGKYFEKMPLCRKLYNDSCIVENAYKVFLSLKIFRKESVCVRNLFYEQATTSCLPTRMIFVLLLFSFRQCYPTINRYVALSWNVLRDKHGSSYNHRRQLVNRFSNCRKGLISFTEGNIEGSSRDYDLLVEGLF